LELVKNGTCQARGRAADAVPPAGKLLAEERFPAYIEGIMIQIYLWWEFRPLRFSSAL